MPKRTIKDDYVRIATAIPDTLSARLLQSAFASGRPISEEVIALLHAALGGDDETTARHLEEEQQARLAPRGPTPSHERRVAARRRRIAIARAIDLDGRAATDVAAEHGVGSARALQLAAMGRKAIDRDRARRRPRLERANERFARAADRLEGIRLTTDPRPDGRGGNAAGRREVERVHSLVWRDENPTIGAEAYDRLLLTVLGHPMGMDPEWLAERATKATAGT